MVRFSCEKALLQGAVNTASRAVAAKSSIPALEGILLEGGDTLTLSGYNMQTGIRTGVDAQIQSPGRIVLSARLFGEMIRKMPDDVIVFDADDKLTVHLTCGDASFEIMGLSADDYPELPEVDDQFSVTLEQRTLKAMINQTSFAVSVNEARPIHTGALFEISDKGLTMVAVDGFRLALRREPLEHIDGGAFKFVAPGAALNEVEKICADTDDMVTVTQGKRHLMFEAGATQLICRRLEGEFLDYKNAIPTTNPICIEVDNKTMIESLDRVSVVISEKLKSPVRCAVQPGPGVYVRPDRKRRSPGYLPRPRRRTGAGDRLQQPLSHGRPALCPGGHGENAAEHHFAHFTPVGGAGAGGGWGALPSLYAVVGLPSAEGEKIEGLLLKKKTAYYIYERGSLLWTITITTEYIKLQDLLKFGRGGRDRRRGQTAGSGGRGPGQWGGMHHAGQEDPSRRRGGTPNGTDADGVSMRIEGPAAGGLPELRHARQLTV